MWLLLIIMLSTSERPMEQGYLLNRFDTQAECEERRAYIEQHMAEAYPGEDDYKIVCQVKV